jgi:hypothetical protein
MACLIGSLGPIVNRMNVLVIRATTLRPFILDHIRPLSTLMKDSADDTSRQKKVMSYKAIRVGLDGSLQEAI